MENNTLSTVAPPIIPTHHSTSTSASLFASQASPIKAGITATGGAAGNVTGGSNGGGSTTVAQEMLSNPLPLRTLLPAKDHWIVHAGNGMYICVCMGEYE
jgi:hypothetical protein